MGDYKILAVDDDPIVLKTLEMTLESGGYRVKIATSGGQALEALHHNHFDVVITDLEMGELDGFAVLRAVKELSPLSGTIVMTGSQNVSQAVKSIKIGVDAYILKPFSSSALLNSVKTILLGVEGKRKATINALEASRSHEQIQEMIMMMSHDIRSALIAMGADIKSLQKKTNEKNEQDISSGLEALSLRCEKLTILAEEYLAKVFAVKNNTDREKQELDLLSEIIVPVLDELSVDIAEKNIAVTKAIDSSIGKMTILGDIIQMKAVFRNVFRNAIRHGGQGATIGFNTEDQDHYYRCTVFNSGPGIAENQQKMLFRAARGPMSNRHDNCGVGIGLHLTRNIMLKHGGDIRYQQINGNPHFVFTLPKDEVEPVFERGFTTTLKNNRSVNRLRCQ